MRFFRVILGVLAIGIAAFAVIRALPPRVVTIEAGPVGGSYYDIALKYRDAFRKHGIDLELRPNPDSLEIVRDVERAGSDIDIGFTAQPVQREQFPHTAAAGAIELQPLFIFYNSGIGQLATLTNLRGKRIVMPPEQSATSEVALRVFRLYDITPKNTQITFMPLADAARALRTDAFDAGVFMLAPSNIFVSGLLDADNLRLLGVDEGKGITRHLPFLRTVSLPRGSVNVEKNIPSDDVELVATTVNVVVRKDIDPAVLYVLLDAMTEVHHGATQISDAGEFPSVVGTDLVPHPLAVAYAKSGMPWIFRTLPLPIASLIDHYLIIGILIFISTEIYKSMKYLGELFNVILENLCLRVLVRIERTTAPGRPVGGVRRFIVHAIAQVLSRNSKRQRSEELIDRISRYADPGD
jgi:TRAP-type uncharacterized transport system substrate-binding protein